MFSLPLCTHISWPLHYFISCFFFIFIKYLGAQLIFSRWLKGVRKFIVFTEWLAANTLYSGLHKSQKADWMKQVHSHWYVFQVSLLGKETSWHKLLNPGCHSKWSKIVQNWSMCIYTLECFSHLNYFEVYSLGVLSTVTLLSNQSQKLFSCCKTELYTPWETTIPPPRTWLSSYCCLFELD